jgi:hypothetical protein
MLVGSPASGQLMSVLSLRWLCFRRNAMESDSKAKRARRKWGTNLRKARLPGFTLHRSYFYGCKSSITTES